MRIFGLSITRYHDDEAVESPCDGCQKCVKEEVIEDIRKSQARIERQVYRKRGEDTLSSSQDEPANLWWLKHR